MELIATKIITTTMGSFQMDWHRNGDRYEWSLLNPVGQYEAGGGGFTAEGFPVATRKARNVAYVVAELAEEKKAREEAEAE
jgi:hypothetical protein